MKRVLLASLLNLVPGFGLGYLVVGRWRGFGICLLAWTIPAAATIVGFVGLSTCKGGGLECLAWLLPFVFGLALGVFGVNLPSAIHLFVPSLKRLRGRHLGIDHILAVIVAIPIGAGVFLVVYIAAKALF